MVFLASRQGVLSGPDNSARNVAKYLKPHREIPRGDFRGTTCPGLIEALPFLRRFIVISFFRGTTCPGLIEADGRVEAEGE